MSHIVEIAELGRRIRKLRLERRMTLKQVEEKSALSATHLSEIERGRTSPTIGALVRIARALEKDASYFIEPEERAEVAHVQGKPVGQLELPGGLSADILTPGIPGSRIFAYRVRLGTGDAGKLTLPHDKESDAIYLVHRGSVSTRFGDSEERLEPGDAVQACLSVQHELWATDGEAEIIIMTTRPLAS
jgi:transcriptional regulator with XRE-family HTH domain